VVDDGFFHRRARSKSLRSYRPNEFIPLVQRNRRPQKLGVECRLFMSRGTLILFLDWMSVPVPTAGARIVGPLFSEPDVSKSASGAWLENDAPPGNGPRFGGNLFPMET